MIDTKVTFRHSDTTDTLAFAKAHQDNMNEKVKHTDTLKY